MSITGVTICVHSEFVLGPSLVLTFIEFIPTWLFCSVLSVKWVLPSLADMLLTCNVGSGLKLAYFNIDIVGVKAGRRPLGTDPPYI